MEACLIWTQSCIHRWGSFLVLRLRGTAALQVHNDHQRFDRVPDRLTHFHPSILPPFHPSTLPPSLLPSFHPSILPPFHPSILPPFHPSTLPPFHSSTLPFPVG